MSDDINKLNSEIKALREAHEEGNKGWREDRHGSLGFLLKEA